MAIKIGDIAREERQGTAALWTSTNPVPRSGEWCFETDTGKGKLGDGVTAWNSLTYSIIPDIDIKPTGTTAQLCKAWVNFDGTTNVGGFCTIRDSYNVTSVTYNGTGDYTINFTNALSNANYSVSGCADRSSSVGSVTIIETYSVATTLIGSVKIQVQRSGVGLVDTPTVSIQIFGS